MRLDGSKLRLSASDVANYLACGHLTRLDALRARGQIQPPHQFDVGFQDLVKRGEAHEQTVLASFRASGWEIIDLGADRPEAEAAQATQEAIRAGADVIYQAVLTGEAADGTRLFGRPDFLVRAGLLPASDVGPGDAHYEVVDAKLARTAKARAVAQVAFYSHLLAAAQPAPPRWMHLALGNSEFTTLKVSDYAAYERQTRRLLGTFLATGGGENPPSVPYPEPVEHCAICRWSDLCAARRREDDDLSLVAGITAGQRRALKQEGIATRRALAALAEIPKLEGAAPDALQRARLQARLQVASEDAGQIQYELLPPERDRSTGELVPDRGLLALPDPVRGDLFFDIEGARYYSEDGKEWGLQYLFGIIDSADTDVASGRPRYHQIWCFNRQGEKRAFEELVDFITERRKRTPSLHVYHYNHYEPTAVDHLSELHETRKDAVGRLMGRFATREEEVDDLFRREVFVDLYRVVRQGIRAGVESYSIKRLEPLCGYHRQVDLRDATESLIAFEAALEDGSAADDKERARVVAGYNEDDCRATIALRDWLESRRAELSARLGHDLPRPAPRPPEEPAEQSDAAMVKDALLLGIPSDPARRSPGQNAKALLGDLLEWHKRDAKPVWWRYFYHLGLTPAELIDESDALGGLAGGAVVKHLKKSAIHRFAFPPQEHRFSPGETAYDPATGVSWVIWEVDNANGTIDLKKGTSYDGPLPCALIEKGVVDTTEQQARLLELGTRVAREGATGQDAATALLMRSRPADGATPGTPLRQPGEGAQDAALRLVRGLRDSYLPVQGPPGAGKTFSAAKQVLALIADGRTVGITGPSHAVIHNVLDKVYGQAAGAGLDPRIGQRAATDNPHLHHRAKSLGYDKLEHGIREGELDVVAGTCWLWSREQFAESVDVLFVDEAGQLSLADVLAVAHSARILVLLGDPQQLAQPSPATHPPGADASALEHILGDHATMPPDAGLLLDRTWRMHPALCHYTSESFYDGKLSTVEGLDRQLLRGAAPLDGAGLRVVEVLHEGNTNASPEEASEVARLVQELLTREWHPKEGAPRPMTPADILVITPYNAQIREIHHALAAADCSDGIQVGTVDKFQGREAPVAIYSMATSSATEAPRGMEFLYDPHRLNVATSRARTMAIIVASPRLIQVSCTTPRQMALANALCRAWESAS